MWSGSSNGTIPSPSASVRAVSSASGVEPAIAQPTPRRPGVSLARERLQGVEAEHVRAAARGGTQRRERRGAARVPYEARAPGDGFGGGRDLRVGDAQQDGVGRGNLAAPYRPSTS